ncbi:pyrroloquinoline quinone biosynthesis protein PqqB [Thioclava sp. L04-15]|uniref:pyrroloquinoline quinone biosynthesis protein PqqB n=1 Tax=Thioclava sp. L04-15 TaxID=1915318 RepID=UPI000997FC79|nr:pyrroloquinoline quinone biosynthesis protein PqqB [Thioclava sp. L04-15]OOY27395.1 pyrroloquinoline quinone biosynthesis protein PqqB [Thioclava sp. L04-15]TNE83489.1 MAG: pyrroloquinoline quinone biosynthesis protein PqqB [Paracoccaceae bacterium]
MTLHARILGAAAGGGLPQWNCGCTNCNLARAGEIPAQTQSSVAVSGNGRDWAILNASPDIREQMARTAELHPTGLRDLPLRSVLVTNGDIDHVAGLLVLRESQNFTLFATPEIHAVLGANPIFDALRPDCVARAPVALDTPFELAPDLSAQLFAVPGKVPLYLEGAEVVTDLEGEQTVGVELRAGKTRAFYIPGCAKLTPALAARLKGADLVMFDGTLWSDDEMIAAGLSAKTGRRMGHISISGPEGSLAAFEGLGIAKRIFVHMNNSNPVLRPDSQERARVEAAGWMIGQDGMEVRL